MTSTAIPTVASVTRQRVAELNPALTPDHTETEWRFVVTEPWSRNHWIIAVARDGSSAPTLEMRFTDDSGRLGTPVACGAISDAQRYGSWSSLAEFESFCVCFAAL